MLAFLVAAAAVGTALHQEQLADATVLQADGTVLQADATVLQVDVTGRELPAPTIFLSFQKSGTSSFANFTRALGLRSMHGFPNNLFHRNPSCCDGADALRSPHTTSFANDSEADGLLPAASRAALGPFLPRYSTILAELTPPRLLRLIQTLDTAADQVWPLLFPYIADALPRSRFVYFSRGAAEWAASFKKFFQTSREELGLAAMEPSRHFLLAYGACRIQDLGVERLQRAYEAHEAAVFHYFSRSAARRSRFLHLNLSAPSAGRQVCATLPRAAIDRGAPVLGVVLERLDGNTLGCALRSFC